MLLATGASQGASSVQTFFFLKRKLLYNGDALDTLQQQNISPYS
jgi:hypothetical protein